MISLEKIPFENFKEPALAKEVLMALQNNIESAINDKNIMARTIERQNITASSSWKEEEVVLSTVTSVGEKLTSVNNAIKIGANVEQVLVSCNIRGVGHEGADGDKDVSIRQNGNEIANSYQSSDATQEGYISATTAPKLVNVSEGDIFTVTISSGGTGTFEILNGYLTVEVVK